MEASEMKEKLFYTKKTVFEKAGDKRVDAAYEYAVNYMKFLDAAKTEREAVIESIKMAENAGFVAYKLGSPVKPGEKYYYNNRGKNIFLFTIGSESIENGIRISAAHIDSPRLDLKPFPLCLSVMKWRTIHL